VRLTVQMADEGFAPTPSIASHRLYHGVTEWVRTTPEGHLAWATNDHEIDLLTLRDHLAGHAALRSCLKAQGITQTTIEEIDASEGAHFLSWDTDLVDLVDSDLSTRVDA